MTLILSLDLVLDDEFAVADYASYWQPEAR
jgi:hypothetical protein